MTNDWSLYSAHRNFATAHALLHAAWDHAQTLDKHHAAQFMYRIMGELEDIGALDSEPRTVLAARLVKKFGHFEFEDYWRVQNWDRFDI